MRLVNWRTLVASAASIALAACGDDVVVAPTIPTLTLNPASVSCVAGTTTAVGVSVGGVTGTPAVTFTGTGTGFTVAGSGTGATITCSSAGSGVINVSVTANGQTVTGSIPVTVTAAPSQITTISVSPQTATIAVGGSITLTPSATTTSTGVTPSYTYSSVNPAIATVSAAGVVTGVAPGIATIRVSTTQAPNLVATATITVADNAQFVQSLTVNPSNIVLQTGGTQTLASTVTLAPGAPTNTSRAVRYTTSDATVATVSSTGVITAVRNGTAVITVASEAAPTVTQAVSVTVRDPAPVRLTIQGVRVINAAGNLVPADLNNVTGNLFLTLNLDPGDFNPDSVRARIGGAVVNCQRFNAQMVEAYRQALRTGSADVQQIECQLNTSDFNPTTGAALVQNGVQNLTAEVFYRPQGAAAGTQTQQAAITQPLTITNQSGFFVRVTNTPSAAQVANGAPANGQATGPQGVLWRAGAVTVQVLPVNFTPVQNPGTQTFQVTLQDANGIVDTRTATADASASTYSVTFPGASGNAFNTADAIGSRSLAGYTSPNAGVAPAFNPQGQFVGGGTLVVIGTQAGTGNTTILNAAGQPTGLNLGAGGIFGNTVSQPIFIDNQAPQPAVTFGSNAGILGPPNSNFAFTGNSFVGFINAAFTFQNSLTPQFLVTANNANSGLTANNPDFGGVDRVTTAFFAGASANANTLTGGTAITSGQSLAPTTTSTANNLAVAIIDALGNRRNQIVQGAAPGAPGNILTINATGTTVSGGQSLQFGVDISAPTLSQSAGFTVNTVAAGGPQSLQFGTADDIGFGTNPLLVTITRTARAATGNANDTGNPANAPSTFCATGPIGGGLVTFAADAGGTCPVLPMAGGFTIPALNGQYQISVQARDQAGNLSNSITRTIVIDATAPTAGGISLPQTLTGNQPVTFTTSATDNLELGSVRGEVDYGAVLGLQFPEQTIGTAFDNVFTASNTSLAITIPSFIRSITQSGGAAPQATRTLASTLRAVVIDLAGNSANSAIGIPAPNLGNLSATSPFTSANPVNNVTSFGMNAQAAGGPAGQFAVQISGGATAGTATSATLTVIQQGAVNTFISPLQRVELYVQVGTNAGVPIYRFVGSVPAGLVTDNANGNGVREIRSSFTLTAATSPLINAPNAGTNTYNVIAVGVNATGDALVSNTIVVTVAP